MNSSVPLSFLLEHVSLVACLLAEHAVSRAFLDGSSLFVLLSPHLLEEALHTPAQLPSCFSDLKGWRRVFFFLTVDSVVTSYRVYFPGGYGHLIVH